MKLAWGDMHAQFKPRAGQSLPDWEQALRQALESGRRNLDFLPIVYYPAFFYTTPQGLRVESVGMRPEFAEHWALVNRLVREYDDPGRFATFPGYEWTGDRTRWGDHNVFFNAAVAPDGDPPLDLSMHVDDLFRNLKSLGALAIPHHTGYRIGDRGKDWDHHDPDISPVMEVFSVHGSSEGCGAPYTMDANAQMSPRTSGGTLHDALARGIRLGVIASGDNGGGFGGLWGTGLAAVWTDELSTGGILRELRNRRCYGVTGDRIRLDYRIGDALMGDVVRVEGSARLAVDVACTDALDRIEIVKNGRVVHTHSHNGTWRPPDTGTVRAKIPIECGWGPTADYGFTVGERLWTGSLTLGHGRIVSTEGRFTTHGQEIAMRSDGEAAFSLRTIDRTEGALTRESQQSIVFEVEAPVDAPIVLEVCGRRMEFTLALAMRQSDLIVFDDGSRAMVHGQFGIDPDEVENPDVFYHNAYIVKRHLAIPDAGYLARVEWEDPDPAQGRNWYYVRVSQLNGQMAWSSPIWTDI
jgi:hypothetical protein